MPDATHAPAATGNAALRDLGRFLSNVPDCGQDADIIMAECSRLPQGCVACEMNPGSREG